MRMRHVKGCEDAVAANPFVIQEPGLFRGRWKQDVFGTDAPLFLEIGTGLGSFIRESSLKNGDVSYIGLEINTTVLYKAVNRYTALLAEQGLSPEPLGRNLRFIRSDARFLPDYFAEGEIDRIYLNFSDPWPKEKSANKRLTSPVFLKHYEHILKQDGTIEFKTDNEGLFDYSLESIPQAGWELTAVTRDLHADPVLSEGNIMTEYEAKFSAKGNRIFKLIAARKR